MTGADGGCRLPRVRTVLWLGLAVLVQDASPPRAVQEALLARLAVDLAGERGVVPISLDADGSGRHGAIFDRFALGHLSARAARQRGEALDPLAPPPLLLAGTLIVLAHPLECDGRTVRPTDVAIEDGGRAVRKTGARSGAAIEAWLPGVTAPAGSLAVQFDESELRPGEVVHVAYAEPACPPSSNRASFPVVMTEARATARPVVELARGQPRPDGPVTLTLGGVVDLDGRLRYLSSHDADAAPIVSAARAAAGKLRLEPARINRTPVPWTGGVIVTFSVVAAEDAPASAAGPVIESADVPGLSAATSRCDVSRTATYGISAFNPVRVGGGPEGRARALRYLAALRGPAGQGLRYQSAGQAMAGRSMVMLERFDVTYRGLAQPVRLYFDGSREERLLAPQGFTCAAPIAMMPHAG